MKLKYISAILLIILLYSCERGVVYSEYIKIPDLIWNAEDEKQFTFEIENDTLLYDFIFMFRHSTTFPVDNMKLTIALIAPDGNKELIAHVFEVKNNEGTFHGSGSGDIWDLDSYVKNRTKLQKGKYTVFLNQEVATKLPYVLDIGFKVKISE